MKTINLELSVKGCERALKELKKYQREIKPKLDEVCRKLAEIGCQAANEQYARADADSAETGNGKVKAVVLPLEGGNGYKIYAEGDDVYFIEFGTGNSAGMMYGDGLPQTSVPVYPGSYSEQNSGQYAKWGYWFYKGKLMSSTDVYMPMYYAEKAIRENERRVVEEVFSAQ
jgi:hypothetical protein